MAACPTAGSQCYTCYMTTAPEDNQPTLESIAESQQALADSVTELDKFIRTVAVATIEAIKGLRSDVDGLTAKVNGLTDDIGMVKGGHARNAMRHNLERIADDFGFKFISEVPLTAIIGFTKVAIAQGTARSEAESFRNADMIMHVQDGDIPAYVTVEASFTVDGTDVRRAVRNAEYLQRFTGLPCHAATAGVEILPEAQAAVDAGQVRFYRIPARELQSE